MILESFFIKNPSAPAACSPSEALILCDIIFTATDFEVAKLGLCKGGIRNKGLMNSECRLYANLTGSEGEWGGTGQKGMNNEEAVLC